MNIFLNKHIFKSQFVLKYEVVKVFWIGTTRWQDCVFVDSFCSDGLQILGYLRLVFSMWLTVKHFIYQNF